MKENSSRLIKFALKLLEFRFRVIHVPGKKNQVADALSRIQWNELKKQGEKPVFQDLLTCHVIRKAKRASTKEPIDLIDKAIIIAAQKADPRCQQIYQEVKTNAITDWAISDDGLIYSRNFRIQLARRHEAGNPILIPRENHEVKRLIFKNFHDSLLGYHFGTDKTMKAIAQHFYWSTLVSDVKAYVKQCRLCQLVKNKPTKLRPIGDYQLPCSAFDTISMDLKGPLPLTKNGNKYLLVVIDGSPGIVRRFRFQTKVRE
jgi:hypothetical protein